MRSRYMVRQPLGRGIRRFIANDHEQRQVVIMRVDASAANQSLMATSHDDLRVSAHLQHPNIVSLLDLGKTPKNVHFVITEYVESVDLKTFVARRDRVCVEHALYVVIECSKTLAYMHARDVLHRNLSARSILVTTQGAVKLINCGHAKLDWLTDESEDVVKRAFECISPEAARGEQVDHRADVFSMGVILWELLAGRRLFVGETDYQTMMLVREPRISRIDRVDPALDEIVRRALAGDRDERFQSAKELGEALTQYASSQRLAIEASTIGKLVRDIKAVVESTRPRKPIDHVFITRVQAELAQMRSILDDAVPPRTLN